MDSGKLSFYRNMGGFAFPGLLVAAAVVLLIAGLIGTILVLSLTGHDLSSPVSLDFFKLHKDKIAVIYIQGQMVADRGTNEEKVACSSDIVKYLRKATDDEDVKAVVLRINSPGGTPVAAEEIILQINKTRKSKPVVVSMGDMATSAAYFVSSATDRVVAYPDTFTGSIGVIWVFKNRSKYYNDEGINFYVAKSGNFKDLGSDWRGLSDDEKDYVQDIVNESYNRFVRSVARGRNLSEDYVRSVADGRIYTGTRAKEMGLVDDLGGLYDAIAVAQKLAGVKGKPQIVYMNEPSVKA
ncbi:MAG: protease 4 [Methanocella sp. PtaU1.Bin125]|nr:MAG: protease 4 [Methanocella sp. PtaU1.Bin125]